MNNNCNQSKSCCFTKIYKKFFSKKNKVAHLLLSGVIGKESKFDSSLNFANYQNLIKKAFTTKNIKAVAISINSPGGSPVQSELIYNYIRLLAKKHQLPVYTFAQDVAASGGYFVDAASHTDPPWYGRDGAGFGHGDRLERADQRACAGRAAQRGQPASGHPCRIRPRLGHDF